jgi:hypothetical protein
MQGYYDDARPFLEEGLELSQAANSRPCLALCQLELGTLSIHQNEHRRAQEMLSEGLQTANAIGNKWDAAWALDAFATLAFRQGSYGRAARLHAASETLLEAYGSKRTDLQRQLQDNTTAMIRKHMNESEFASASAEGRGLTMEEAIEYAIGG